MGTIYTVSTEPNIAFLASADQFPVFDSSASLTGHINAVQLHTYLNSVVNTTETGTVVMTEASHNGRLLTISSAGALELRLPAATGTGDRYRGVFLVAATATSHTVKVNATPGTDVMTGYAFCVTTSSDNAEGFKTSATSDTMTFNGTTLGGVVGDMWEAIDVATGTYMVRITSAPTGTEATPFSATV